MLLDEGVELRLGAAEDVFRIALHQQELAGVGACGLADGLADGPEPAHVDVRVPHGGHVQHGTGGLAFQRGLEFGTGQRGACGVLAIDIAGAVEDGHQAFGAVVLGLVVVGQEKPEVLELDAVVVECLVEESHAEVGDHGIHGALRGGVAGCMGLVGQSSAEEMVGDRFHPQVKLLAAFGGLLIAIAVLAVVFIENAVVGEAPVRRAVILEEQRLAAEVEAQHKRLAFPRLRNGSGEVQPGALPDATPAFALRDGAVLEGFPLGPRHRLVRHGDFRLEGGIFGEEILVGSVEEFGKALEVVFEFAVSHCSRIKE